MTENAPYRHELPVVQPVCAKCKHRADAAHMDPHDPWRDWRCLASPCVILREEYNPITGTLTPAKMGHDRCREVNSAGDCTKFAAIDEPAVPDTGLDADTVPDMIVPTAVTRRAWWRFWRRGG